MFVLMVMALALVLSGPEPCLSGQGALPRYVDAVPYRDGFAVLRSDGTVELAGGNPPACRGKVDFGLDGGVKFISRVQDALVAGSDSSMVCLLDGRLIAMKLPSGASARLAADFGGAVIAAGGENCAYFWDSPYSKPRRLPFSARGECVGLSGSDWLCCALTDSSELVLFSPDLRASVFDFNSSYEEYYGHVSLNCVAVGASSVCVAGTDSLGRPVAYISSKGSVWSQRPLEYTMDGRPMRLESAPVAAEYNEAADEFVLVCADGTLFHLPSCSHCNYPEYPDSGRLVCIAFNGDEYLAAGDSLY